MYLGEGSEKRFEFQPGPVFANIVLADEVNRAPAKVQAALLEAGSTQCALPRSYLGPDDEWVLSATGHREFSPAAAQAFVDRMYPPADGTHTDKRVLAVPLEAQSRLRHHRQRRSPASRTHSDARSRPTMASDLPPPAPAPPARPRASALRNISAELRAAADAPAEAGDASVLDIDAKGAAADCATSVAAGRAHGTAAKVSLGKRTAPADAPDDAGAREPAPPLRTGRIAKHLGGLNNVLGHARPTRRVCVRCRGYGGGKCGGCLWAVPATHPRPRGRSRPAPEKMRPPPFG